jgi:catechol 2,3-dioxygenase-like lactoylglutathione lyase family enzyme
MFDHIQLKVKDLNLSKGFYTAALAPLEGSHWSTRATD